MAGNFFGDFMKGYVGARAVKREEKRQQQLGILEGLRTKQAVMATLEKDDSDEAQVMRDNLQKEILKGISDFDKLQGDKTPKDLLQLAFQGAGWRGKKATGQDKKTDVSTGMNPEADRMAMGAGGDVAARSPFGGAAGAESVEGQPGTRPAVSTSVSFPTSEGQGKEVVVPPGDPALGRNAAPGTMDLATSGKVSTLSGRQNQATPATRAHDGKDKSTFAPGPLKFEELKPAGFGNLNAQRENRDIQQMNKARDAANRTIQYREDIARVAEEKIKSGMSPEQLQKDPDLVRMSQTAAFQNAEAFRLMGGTSNLTSEDILKSVSTRDPLMVEMNVGGQAVRLPIAQAIEAQRFQSQTMANDQLKEHERLANLQRKVNRGEASPEEMKEYERTMASAFAPKSLNELQMQFEILQGKPYATAIRDAQKRADEENLKEIRARAQIQAPWTAVPVPGGGSVYRQVRLGEQIYVPPPAVGLAEVLQPQRDAAGDIKRDEPKLLDPSRLFPAMTNGSLDRGVAMLMSDWTIEDWEQHFPLSVAEPPASANEQQKKAYRAQYEKYLALIAKMKEDLRAYAAKSPVEQPRVRESREKGYSSLK